MRLAIVGAGGLGRVVAESLIRTGIHDVVGFVDDAAMADQQIHGFPLLGRTSDLASLRCKGVQGAVLAIGNNAARRAIADKALAAGLQLPAVVDASAIVSPTAQLSEGAIVLAGAIIGPSVAVGRLAVLSTGSVLEHDVAVGDCCYVGPRSLIDARARLSAGAFVKGGQVVPQDQQIA